MHEVLNQGVVKIALVANVLEALHSNEIRYCHWKSNEHLDASMTGDTDLDVLFDHRQRDEVERVLAECGFKKFEAIRQKQYRDIVDFLGLDPESGKLVHVHTHYRLTLGEPFLKGYQLQLEDMILDSRVWNDSFGIFTSHPAMELALLYLRETLKLRTRDRVLLRLKNKVQFNEFILREYRWLKERTNDAEVVDVVRRILPSPLAAEKFFTGPFNRVELLRLAPLLRRQLKDCRMYSPLGALVRRWYREAVVVSSRKLNKIFGFNVLSKRINPRGGLVVAVIGADGSGKSTVTTNLRHSFESKLDVYRIYFGRGDGKSSRARKVLTSVKTRKQRTTGQSGDTEKQRSFLKTLYKAIEALLVSREKRVNLKLMNKARAQKAFVICDRFPQYQIMGYNDGPLLHNLRTSKNPLLRFLSMQEEGVYKRAQLTPPDLVIKLIAEAEVVEARKPGETSIDKLTAKIDGIKQLKFHPPCKVLTIDASIPLQEVLIRVRKTIWELM